MNINGFMKTTLLDYPGKVACTIFTSSCNLRCPFCQNADLVFNTSNEVYDQEDVLLYLAKRRKVLDGVCISGGEPTLQKDLSEFIYHIKSLGYSVKLDTNGFFPSVIKKLYEGNLLDYVAMDIKSSFAGYAMACGITDINLAPVKESIDYIMNCGVDYEFRTTLVKGIHSFDDMKDIADSINNAKAYFIQSYVHSDKIIGHLTNTNLHMSSFTPDELNTFLEIANKKIPAAKLRGM